MGEVTRATRETRVAVRLVLDGSGACRAETPYAFFNHMLEQMAFYAMFDLEVSASGDLPHHVIEDCGIAVGKALAKALGDRSGIARYGYAVVPMDDALALAAVDLGGRAYARVNLGLRREAIGDTPSEDLVHFLLSLAHSAGACLHVYRLAGENDHHVAETAFKALGMALRAAVALDERRRGVPSTKGVVGP